MKLSSTTALWWERGATRGTAPLPQSVRASSPPSARSSSRGSGGRRKAATCSRRLQKVCGVNLLRSEREWAPSPPPFSLVISVTSSFHQNSSMHVFLPECYRPLLALQSAPTTRQLAANKISASLNSGAWNVTDFYYIFSLKKRKLWVT